MKNVEDIYPVSPMQEAMLLHSLAHRGDDTLFNQFCFEVDAPLDAAVFEMAWMRTVQRHPALRTAFLWDDLPKPLQVVRKQAPPEFVTLDWRDVDPGERDQRYDRLLADDRAAGFDPRRAPLMRFKLIRMSDQTFQFVWTSHHLVIDRWCIATVLNDVAAWCTDPDRGPADAPAPPFRRYIDWLRRQDRDAAEDYWRGALAGHQPASAATADATASETAVFSPARFDALTSAARRHGLTPGIFLQGAWSLALNRLTGSQDVVFGATVSGRPADIPDIEHIVGSFINNVPVRRIMPADTGLFGWLADAQREQFERGPFEYLSPADIARSAGGDLGSALFDSLFVWLADAGTPDALGMRPVAGDYATAYPVTLSVAERAGGLTLRVERRHGRTAIPAGPVLPALTEAIDNMIVAEPGAQLGDLPGFDDSGGLTSRGEMAVPSVVSGIGRERGAPATDRAEALRGREQLDETAIREMLSAEWQSMLGVDSIDPDDSFFELGGTSLQAARLHAHVEAATGQSVPLLALFQSPTLSGMARTLTSREWPLRSGLISALRASGRRTPLFCIASPEVNALGYAMLARHLRPDQDVYVVQAPPVSARPDELDPATLPALAAQYLDAIRELQPSGPYRFLSMCAGSHITTEMVRALETDGERVDFFGVVNTYALYTITNLYYVNRLRNVALWYAGRIRDLFARRTGRDAPNPQADAGMVGGQPTVSVPPQGNEAVGLDNPWIRDVGFSRRNPNRPKLETPVTVFRIGPQPFWRKRDRALGWGLHSRAARAVMLTGDVHLAIMREPHVRELADALTLHLADAATPRGNARPPASDETIGITA